MKNIEYIKKIEEERTVVAKVLANADRVVMDIICQHCENKYCSQKGHRPLTVEQEEFCINGTIDWFNKEKK